jgi:GNAT superfamily N-acetyltransferase
MRDRPSAEFLDLLRARRAGLPAAAEHVLTSVPEVRFAEVRADDEGLLAIARGAVVEDWLHLGLVDVVPAARRRGLARTASNALATWALGRGATRAFLQVEKRNGPAVRLWSRLGFTTHHTYVTYRREP